MIEIPSEKFIRHRRDLVSSHSFFYISPKILQLNPTAINKFNMLQNCKIARLQE